MKKISKKLSLSSETVRVLSSSQLEQVAGGTGAVAEPTTTVLRHSKVANAATPCRILTGGVHTAPCRYTA